MEQLLTRDAATLASRRDPSRLRRYFEAYALNTAGIVHERTLFEAAGVDRRTGAAHERLLTDLLVVEGLPAWSSNRLKRLTHGKKRHLVDPGLLVGATGPDADAVLRDGDLLGRLLESFVSLHLRTESVIAECRPRLYHLRTEQGRQDRSDRGVRRGLGRRHRGQGHGSARFRYDQAPRLAAPATGGALRGRRHSPQRSAVLPSG